MAGILLVISKEFEQLVSYNFGKDYEDLYLLIDRMYLELITTH